MEVSEEIKGQMNSVDALIILSAKSTDGTEAMKFAQAALNACEAIGKKYMCIGANDGYVYRRKNDDVIELSHFTESAKERIRDLVNKYSDGRESL